MGITRTEALQIVNIMPSTAVELYLIIQNIEERYNDAQVLEILEIVKSNS